MFKSHANANPFLAVFALLLLSAMLLVVPISGKSALGLPEFKSANGLENPVFNALIVLEKLQNSRYTGLENSDVPENNLPPVTFTGSGPVPGVIAIHPKVKSTKALENYVPKDGSIEFVFDPKTKTFAAGKPKDPSASGLQGSPHQQLAKSIDADPKTLVGGTLQRGKNGEFITDELSGHYGKNWTPEVRKQYKEFLENMTGKEVNHEAWGN